MGSRKNSVQIDRVVDVQRSQKCKHVSLDGAYQQLKKRDANHQDERRNADHQRNPSSFCVEAVDDKASQNLHQHVARCHGDKKTKREAEGTNKEREKLDQRDKPQQPPRCAMWNKQAEKVQAVLPKANNQDGPKADHSKDGGYGKVAGNRERVHAGNDTKWHHAHEVRHEDEHKQ